MPDIEFSDRIILGMMHMITVLKRFICPFICLLVLLFVILNLDNWTNVLARFITNDPTIIIDSSNEYQKDTTFLFVKAVNDYTPLSKGDIKNIFYTIVNNGWEEFTFYCPSEYTECLNDVKEISHDQDLLTHLNNFVHPYNGFSNVKTEISQTGEITVHIEYIYTEAQIVQINEEVNRIFNELIHEGMDDYTKILTIHDYIINHSKYDVERNDSGDSRYHSYLAYGPLLEGYATCNGYTDAMALFLEKMNIPNFKVAMTPDDVSSSEGHVWNAVNLNGTWYHLDLTWDDPVSTDGVDYLQHKYFLITTEQLEEVDSSGEVKVTEHQFKKNIYVELK